ncbi:MAG TPA: NUDIX domain-containing protein, partial [Candidatus Saccharimonadales bacterium]|nr:NUDIX domain-containing protein [Candidatus Saccharimonadales bacterium]
INSEPDIHKLVICANCFVKKGDRYLVLKRSEKKRYAPGVIHPIGGKVNLNENPYACAIREVREEAGITVTNLRLRTVFLEIKPNVGDPHNWMIFHFLGDYESGEIHKTEEGELMWLTTDEVKKAELFPSVRVFINEILDEKLGTAFSTIEYDETKQKITKYTKDHLYN